MEIRGTWCPSSVPVSPDPLPNAPNVIGHFGIMCNEDLTTIT